MNNDKCAFVQMFEPIKTNQKVAIYLSIDGPA